jgi:signal transduction histidine kinase
MQRTALPAGMTGRFGSRRIGSGAVAWTRRTFSQPRPSVWVFLWLAAAAAEFGVFVPVIFNDGGPVTTLDVLSRAVGGSFLACGLIAWHRRPQNRTGRLMVATGFAFFLEPLLGQVDSAFAQTAGSLLADAWTIVFVALLLSFPSGRGVRSLADRLVFGAFVAHLALQFAWLLFLPQTNNLLAAFPNAQVAGSINKAAGWVTFGASVAAFALLAMRWKAANRPMRRALSPSLAGGISLLLFASFLLDALVTGSRSEPLLFVTVAGLLLVPLAFLIGLLRSRFAHAGVSDLFADIGSMRGGELQAALAKALGDQSLILAYWLPEFQAYVNARGEPVSLPAAGDDRLIARIVQDGRHVAALVYDSSLAEEHELLDAVCGAAGIALESERLHAELRARLEELRGSRARVIEAGQKERQRLERNLHDGAQQRLIALSLELSLLEEQLDADPHASARLGQARREIAASLGELREVARGIHPAVVSGHGLAVALEQLAARAPVPISLTVDIDGRLPEPLEVAAYYLVAESLANVGKYAQASSASVEVNRRNGQIVVEVADDGIGGADTERGSGLRGLADRVEALDGQLRIWSPKGGGTRLRAEIPCAS